MAQSVLLSVLGTAFGLMAPFITSPNERHQRAVQLAFVFVAVLCWRLV